MTIEEKRAHNQLLEQSPEFQKILPEVEKEVCTQFVLMQIRIEEKFLAEYGDNEESVGYMTWGEDDDEKYKLSEHEIFLSKRSNRIMEAKRLLEEFPDQPIHAARIFMQLGSCHSLWAMQKNLLKEKYGITWYTPAELNPDVIYD